jgi:predicted site-specific integrase-resolvase
MKKLSQYAKENNITYRTAWNHFHAGLIEHAYQLPTGTVVIPDSTPITCKSDHVITYARVSSSENKSNLSKQSQRLQDFCFAKGWTIKENIVEIGSGLNDKRPKLLSVLSKAKASKLVVEHKDRLTRFGFEYIKTACQNFGCEIVVLNSSEDQKENIIEDFVSVITSFCAKIYGHRRSKRKTEQLIKELQND